MTYNDKPMTIDDLAGMVARGIERSDKRFDSIDAGLKDIKGRLGKVEFQVDEAHDILKRFEETDILNLQKRVHVLEKAVRSLSAQLAAVSKS